MEWRVHFRDIILARGQSYYYEGRVDVKTLNQHQIVAKVKGSKSYSVEVDVKNKRIEKIYCSCPHAAEDNFCKHMAATLCAYEKYLRDVEVQQLNKSAEKYVNEAEEKHVREFLLQLLQNDHSLLQSFIASLGEPISTEEMNRYKRQLYAIFEDYLDSDYFIDYEDSWGFRESIDDFMETVIENLLMQNGYWKEAFDLSFEIFMSLNNVSMEDSGDTVSDIAMACMEIWEKVIDAADAKLNREIFVQCKLTLETTHLDYLEDYLEQIIFDTFDNEEFREPKKSLIKKKISSYEKGGFDYSKAYFIQKWGIRYLKLVTDDNEVKSFYEEYIDYPEIRIFFAEHLISRGNLEEAIQVLEDGIKREESPKNNTFKANEILKDLYLEVGEVDKYLKELFKLVCYHGYTRKDLYEEYRDHFSEEDWTKELPLLIENISLVDGLDDILRREKKMKQLLEVTLNSRGMSMVEKHEDVLYEKYPNLILDKYEHEVLDRSRDALGRKVYRQVAYLIRKMGYLENSEERVEKLLDYLRKEYKNRPAMMEELETIN